MFQVLTYIKMRQGLYILICAGILIGILALIPAPASADHTTCSEEVPELCGALIDWQYSFSETPVRGPGISEFFDSEDPDGNNRTNPFIAEDFNPTLADSNRADFRNLYHGISTIKNDSVGEPALGEGPHPSSHWLPGDSNYRPVSLSTEFTPQWFSIFDGSFSGLESTTGDGETNFGRSAKLSDGTERVEAATWQDTFWGSDNVNIEESNWNEEEWNLHEEGGKFKPKQVIINSSLPDNTTIKFEIYEPVDPDDVEDNPSDHLLGYAEFNGSEMGGDTAPALISAPIQHDTGSGEEFGLSEYHVPEGIGDGGPNRYAYETGDIRTYHIRAVIERGYVEPEDEEEDDDGDGLVLADSPVISLDNSIRLSEPIPQYRLSNLQWFGYPVSLPSLAQVEDTSESGFDQGDRFKVTSQRDSGFQEDFVLGHTETMVKNFNETIQSTDNSTSVAPQIPRDPVNQEDKIEEFYHGVANGTPTSDDEDLYHVKSDENKDADNHVFFHHVYSDLPRAEMSAYYQDDYSEIYENWNTVVSDDGVVYALTDGAVNNIDHYNTNYRGESHEEKNSDSPDPPREYDYDFSMSGSLDVPQYSKDSFSEDDLKTNAIRMSYKVKNFEIMPEIGGRYRNEIDIGAGGYIPFVGFSNKVVFEEPVYQEPRDFIIDYNQDRIDSNRPSDSHELTDFYSTILNVTVTYDIEYERLKYQSSSCPSPDMSVGTRDVDPDPPPGNETIELYAVGGPSVKPADPPDHDTEDSTDLYAHSSSGYSSYTDAEYGSTQRNDEGADGRKECSDHSSVGGSTDEYISGIEWIDSDWDFAEDHTWHDDANQVTFNATDDGVGAIVGGEEEVTDSGDDGTCFLGVCVGGTPGESVIVPNVNEDGVPSDNTTSLYSVDEFANTLWEDERRTDEAFEVQNAIGSSNFESLTYFDRDTSVGSDLQDTRWTRTEARAIQKRGSISLNYIDGERDESVYVPDLDAYVGDFNEPVDTTGIDPLNGTVGERTDVYLDIINYGPASPNDELGVKVNGTYVNETLILPDTGDDGHGKYDYAYDPASSFSATDYTYDISDVVYNSSTIDIEFEYNDSSAAAEDYDLEQRIDYVVTFDTKRALNGLESRWAYSTFRDTRYDALYEFESVDCAVEPDKDCYDYNNHSIPFTSLDGERGTYNDYDTYSQPNPEDGNPVTTHYPSRSMISNPYLVPSSDGIENRESSTNSRTTRPVVPSTKYLEEEVNVESYDVQDQTDITLEADGQFVVEELGGTILEPAEQGVPPGQPQEFVSINIHEFYSELEEDPDRSGLDLEHWSNDNFPAMMQYPVLDSDGELTSEYDENFEWNEGALPDGYDSDDIEVHNLWFEDGRIRLNATVPNRDFYDDMAFSSDVSFVVPDFPPSVIQNWRDWDSLDDDEVADGLLFGGYEAANYDQIRRHELSSSDTIGTNLFDVSLSDVLDVDGSGSIDGTYIEQADSWVVKSGDVESELDSDDPMTINYIDWSPLSSDECAQDPNSFDDGVTVPDRYCELVIANMAGYNHEEAYRQGMTSHLNEFAPPVNRDMEQMPFIEHTEFELKSGDRAYSSWSVAADASWSTRKVGDDKTNNPKLFDSPSLTIRPINNVTDSLSESQISNYESQLSAHGHEFVEDSEVTDDSIQQFALTVQGPHESPISFEKRTTGTGIDIPDSPDNDLKNKEGVCITVSGGDLTPNLATQDNKKCYSTNENGTIYYVLESEVSDKNAVAIEQEVEIVGSEHNWWEYGDGRRLIESSQDTYSTIDVSDPSRTAGGLSDSPLIAAIVLFIIMAYTLSLAFRIRPNPSSGPDTLDIMKTATEPFLKEPIERFAKMMFYTFVYLLGFSVMISTFGADVNPFFMFEAVISVLWDGIVDLL